MTKFCGYSFVVFLTSALSVGSLKFQTTTASWNEDPSFRCDNGERTTLTRHNDGADDCGDSSDEYDEALVLYTVLHPKELTDPVLRGFFLKSDEGTFRTRLMTSCSEPWTLLGAHGLYLYMTCPGKTDHLFQVMRNGSLVQDIFRKGRDVQALVFDEVVSNAYLLENARIKLCDVNFEFCSLLHGERRHKPISLAFSSELGMLFWIEEKTERETHIISAQRDGTGVKVILQDTADPYEFVTVDRSYNRLYWIGNATKNIFSTRFDGTDKKLHGIGLNYVHTFAVDRGRLFWADQGESQAETCDTETNARSRCNPAHFKSQYSKVRIGRNIIVHKGIAKNTSGETPAVRSERLKEMEVEGTCERSTCSHLCTYLPGNTHTCFCDASDTGTVLNPNNGFCEGVTLLATRGNHLYVLGLKSRSVNRSLPPIIRRTTIKNMDEISAVTYDSVRGRVILAGVGQQNVYAWTLGRSEPELMIEGGQGTVSSLEFDDVGNNIYWISPTNCGTLRVASCITNKTFDILIHKNSSSVLFDFTLDTKRGYVFTLSKTDASINLERISMDGDESTRQLVHHFDHTFNTTHLSLHYMRSKDVLILMDRLNNVIKYVEMKKYRPDGIFKFEYLIDNDLNTLDSVTSVEEFAVWTEADGSFRSIEVPNQDRNPVHKMSLSIPDDKVDGPMHIAGVVVARDFTHSGCRIEEGGCQHLCLVSDAISLVCQCSSASCEDHGEHEALTNDTELIEPRRDSQPRTEKVTSQSTHDASVISIEECVLFFVAALIATIISLLVYKYKFAVKDGRGSMKSNRDSMLTMTSSISIQ